jgi:hypothetical protein
MGKLNSTCTAPHLGSLVSTYGMVSSSPFFTSRTVSTVTHPCASND